MSPNAPAEHITGFLRGTISVGDAVYFLALGTQLMTGQVVVVDGGRTM